MRKDYLRLFCSYNLVFEVDSSLKKKKKAEPMGYLIFEGGNRRKEKALPRVW